MFSRAFDHRGMIQNLVKAMSIASVALRLRRVSSRFRAAENGNIAVIFAIALVPLLGFVGAAIDYSRATTARSAMQSALDSAA